MVALVIVVTVLVELFNLGNGFLKFRNSAGALELLNGLRAGTREIEPVALLFSSCSLTEGTSEEVLVFLLWEVNVIVAMGMRVLSWVPSVISVPRVSPKLFAVVPGFKLEVTHRSALVVVAHRHRTLVRLVVNRFSAQQVLFLFAQAFKHKVGANFHDVYLLLETCFRALLLFAALI